MMRFMMRNMMRCMMRSMMCWSHKSRSNVQVMSWRRNMSARDQHVSSMRMMRYWRRVSKSLRVVRLVVLIG